MRKLALSLNFLVILTVLTAAAKAGDATTPETVVVTATRTPQPRDVTGASISVITAKDIETQQLLVVGDVLKEVPGVSVNRNGGVGQTTSINIRGATPGQTLILIDGVRLNDPSTPDGTAELGDILVNNIDRIEVLRGPQSTLYGSQAIGGIVNIMTLKGGGDLSARGEAEGGSFGTYHLNAAANGTNGIVEYGAAANYFDTTGISAADAKNGNTEPDGYRNFGATGNARVHVSDNVSVDLRGFYTNSRTDFDGFPPPAFVFKDDSEFGKSSLLAGYAAVNVDLLDGRLSNRIALTGSDVERKNYNPATTPLLTFISSGNAQRLEYQGTFNLDPADQLVFGAEDERTSLSTASPSSFAPNPAPLTGHVNIASYYGQLQSTLMENLTVTGGVRYDDHQTFGGHTSVKLAGAWQIFDGGTTLRANYGDGFKAPTLYQLFSPYSNPTHVLAPETARGWEVGVDQSLFDGMVRASATYFMRTSKNQIAFASCFLVVSAACTARPFGYYDNIARSRTSGIELEASAQLGDTVTLSANYTHMSAVDLSDHTDLAREPRDLAFVQATWTPLDKWSVGGSIGVTGSSFNSAHGLSPLAGYVVTNLFTAYQLRDNLELFGRIDNLLDEQYEQILGYGTPGRAVYAGVRAHI